MTDEELQEMIDEADRDGDGEVNEEVPWMAEAMGGACVCTYMYAYMYICMCIYIYIYL